MHSSALVLVLVLGPKGLHDSEKKKKSEKHVKQPVNTRQW